MKRSALFLVAGNLLCVALTAPAITRYVDLNNPAPASPYTSWGTAARNIQDAVDVAVVGDEIVVTNGVYQTGARAVYGMNNRVAVTRSVTVRSLNGPEVTSIVGYQVPGTTNGPTAVRCVYLTSGAVLTGFTLTNGATQISGAWQTNQTGGGVWCESSGAVVSNCVLAGNSALMDGGGAYRGWLVNCTLTGNSANYGGGASHSTLSNCTLTGNSARSNDGGGATGSTLNNCTLRGNSADGGGGASFSTLNNCTLTCNCAAVVGGGTWQSTLNNCTLTGNFASNYGGGAHGSLLNNCIVYYNTAPSGPNYYQCALNYSCAAPLSMGGTGNTDVEPQLASASHLSANSPCVGRGSAAYAVGVDVDAEPWASPPSIGCDEYWSGSVTGALSVAIEAAYTNVAVGFGVGFKAVIGGRVSASRWDFGDGVVVSNRPFASHAWGAPGDYEVELRAFNESYPAGIGASVLLQILETPVRYVALTSTNPVAPYSSWATAAANIQEAVDVAGVPGALVWVSNGVYRTGGRPVYGVSNRVAVTKLVVVRSVNGPEVTSIVGSGPTGAEAVRCVYLTGGAVLAGFTLTNGATQFYGDTYTNASGGGVWCEGTGAVVSNCVLTGNSAYYYGGGAYNGMLTNCTLTGNSAYEGGGAALSTLNNCTLTGNSARFRGGGAIYATLNNCTLTGNSAQSGGGAASSTLNNCTLTGNSADYGGGAAYYATLNDCTLRGNSATNGGGAYAGTLDHCTLTGNSARFRGGGASGSTLNNCVLATNLADYEGGGAFGGTLNHCTLTGNLSYNFGGGASQGALNNCILTGNSAFTGGGAVQSPLTNCILAGNRAWMDGGGASGSTLNNCTLAGNSAYNEGGGAAYATLNNCIAYYNEASIGPNYSRSTLNYCCATPLAAGSGNLTNVPLLVDTNGWSNLRLQAASPCINAGNDSYLTNSYFTNCLDLDGNPRISGGRVDIGAYEYQFVSPFQSWLAQYGLPTDGSADYVDSDGDGHNNWQEWVAGTNPTNAASALRMLSATGAVSGVMVTWSSVTNRSYALGRATNLSGAPAFSVLQSNIAGWPDTTIWTDTDAVGAAARFYRVRVEQ